MSSRTITDDRTLIMECFKSTKDYPYLIIDIRGTGDGTVNEQAHTKPDIFVETTYNDFLEDKDTVLNKAVKMCK
jgi:hypothetical protein